MKKMNSESLENFQGGYDKLALFGCGMGIAFMMFNPVSVFAIGEVTGAMCAIGIASI